MAVNTTTYIGLKKPTEDELALNWTRSADIIEDNNTQIIDKADVNIQPKTQALTASTTAPNLGAGSITMEIVDFEGFVTGSCNIVFTDPGVSAGSGVYGVSLPFEVNATYHAVGSALTDAPGAFDCIGEGYFYDSSAVGTSGSLAIDAVTVSGTSYARFITETFAGKTARHVTNSQPVAPATGDRITFSFVYKKA